MLQIPFFAGFQNKKKLICIFYLKTYYIYYYSVINLVKMPCSFCHSHSHNINMCQDQMIGVLYERIKVIYVEIMTRHPNTIEINFKSILNRRFDLRELRVVGVKFLNILARTRNSKASLIDIIWEHFRIRIYQPVQEETELLEVRRLPTVPDAIPSFAIDLEQPTSQEEHEDDYITWYIDTTPSRLLDVLNQYSIDGVRRNLNIEFNNADNIHHNVPQIEKYDISLILVQKEEEKEEEREECAICYENINCMDLVKLNCNHTFCSDCIKGTLNANKNNSRSLVVLCALCREPMRSFSVKTQEIYNLVEEHCNL